MITKQEIMDAAREFSLSPNTIEKDYVLGWLLAGIANYSELFNQWIFKGGTCLKKCYFETYRFSEDLDYTLKDDKQLNEVFLVDCFKKISSWIYDASGIEIPVNSIRFEVYQNTAGKLSVEGRIGYIGPLQRRNDPARIKLDLTADEILVLSPELRDVHHPYSDKSIEGMKSQCYSFPEIFAEKLRALSERARPRDLYDVIHLYRHAYLGVKPEEILEVLKKKCDFKSIPVPTMIQLQNHPKLHELETEWSSMLAHQLPMLPPREQFWDELSNVFDWLHGTNEKVVQSVIPSQEESIDSDKVDITWRPPNMINSWRTTVPLELVRYAAANHLCVELTYGNTKRIIEPYDLKRTKSGNLILVAVKYKTGETRTYRVDRIQRISITQITFKPRYLISLTPFMI